MPFTPINIHAGGSNVAPASTLSQVTLGAKKGIRSEISGIWGKLSLYPDRDLSQIRMNAADIFTPASTLSKIALGAKNGIRSEISGLRGKPAIFERTDLRWTVHGTSSCSWDTPLPASLAWNADGVGTLDWNTWNYIDTWFTCDGATDVQWTTDTALWQCDGNTGVLFTTDPSTIAAIAWNVDGTSTGNWIFPIGVGEGCITGTGALEVTAGGINFVF
jgi:hypothetical protein